MKILSDSFNGPYDLSILGLGYEERASSKYKQEKSLLGEVLAFGYLTHNEILHYKTNKDMYISGHCKVFEGNDNDVKSFFKEWLDSKIFEKSEPINVLIDITVFSRPRLAALLYILVKSLPKKSTLTISYEISKFVAAPDELSPIRKVGDIIPELSGTIGDLNKPTALILGLGYEDGKAFGLATYLEPEFNFALIPIGVDKKFDDLVVKNNKAFLNEIPNSRIVHYRLDQPYNTYIDMRDLISATSSFATPLIAPLGPKILTAISVLIAIEFDEKLPVWRVSSDYEEKPVNRKPSGNSVNLSVLI
ncbi:hypothetical protein QNE95_002085 [Vibrio vulnificus]|nr:hypothetical protein [Vibrio vulnificus]ELV8598922.1 hypothetical protein [Vibrio vulnificus]MCU8460783.1 hypothetical protein [Vibrio vulnificus]HAS8134059.1 hypothetical protein [Vibrio vulnificus]HAS8138357.1 hypothetical protein [Vibrio vulnificus]